MKKNYNDEFERIHVSLVESQNYTLFIEECKPFIENINQLTPLNQLTILYQLAFASSKLNNEVEAIRYCEEGIKLILQDRDKTNTIHDFCFQLGVSFSRLNRDEEAQKAFDEYVMYIFKQHSSIGYGHFVYSYRSINPFTLKDLINKEITVVNPSKFNDPFDCLFYQLFDPQIPVSFDNKALKKSFEKVRIRSFVAEESLPTLTSESQTRKIHPAHDMLMWSHYANDHKGICVKYSLSHHFPANKPGGYSQFFNEKYTAEKVVDISNNTALELKKGFLSKQKCWEHEQEIRLLYFDPECDSDYVSLPLDKESKVAAIYFGLYCSGEDVKMIQNIFKDKGVAFYRMGKSLTDIYNLTANKIE